MKKFFAGLKSVLIWFQPLTYPIVLILLIPIFWISSVKPLIFKYYEKDDYLYGSSNYIFQIY